MISYKIIFSEPNGLSGVAPKKTRSANIKNTKYKQKQSTDQEKHKEQSQKQEPETRHWETQEDTGTGSGELLKTAGSTHTIYTRDD